MPGSLLNADVMFPKFTEGQSNDEKIEAIQSYLFMLLEELRYSFGNISEENFTEAGLEVLSDIITAPIYVQLYGEGGGSASLQLSEGGLFTRIQNAEGSISTLTQTANGLSSKVTALDGAVSRISQTVNGITLSVENGEKSSTIKLLSNGMQIGSTGTIQFTGNVVFKSDLENEGSTVINAGNITTGTIYAIGISSCEIAGGTITGSTFVSELYDNGTHSGELIMKYKGFDVAGMYLDRNGAGDVSEAQNRMYIYTGSNFAMKLESSGGMSLESLSGGIFIGRKNKGTVNVSGTDIYLVGNVYVNGTKI